MKLDLFIPPAQAGENFSSKIGIQSCPDSVVTFLDIKIPETIHLSVNLVEGNISGKIDEPGEHPIEIKYFTPGQYPITEKKCIVTLHVLPNPKLMWRNLPSDQNGIFSVPDTKSFNDKNAYQHFIAASKRGRSHAHVGSYREDDFSISLFDEWSISVVSDGAGSSKYSRKAAEIICRNVPVSIRSYIHSNAFRFDSDDLDLVHHFFSGAIYYALEESLSEIEDVSAGINSPDGLKEFYATALICITKKVNSKLLIVSYSIGDGAIAIYDAPDKVKLPISSDTGDYSGQTKFLDHSAVNMSDVYSRISVNLISDYTSIFIMSDGVSDPYFETDSMLSNPEKWNYLWTQLNATKMFSQNNPEEALLDWLDFWSKGNHDDRTIVIITTPDNHA